MKINATVDIALLHYINWQSVSTLVFSNFDIDN